MDLLPIFKQNGLTEKETNVYLALLQLGKTTAYYIANKTGYNRPTVYATLEKLRGKDLVFKIPHADKQVFTAKNPSRFSEQLQKNAHAFEQLLPQLIAMTARSDKPDILFFEGLSGLDEANAITNTSFFGKHIRGFYAYSPDEPSIAEHKYLQTINKRLHDLGTNNTKIRALVPEYGHTREHFDHFKKYNWELAYIPLEHYAPFVSLVFDDEYIQIISRQKQQSIVIKNNDIAQLCGFIFELAWVGAHQKISDTM